MNEILRDTRKPPSKHFPRLVVLSVLCEANRSGKQQTRISKITSEFPKIKGIENCIDLMLKDGLLKNAGRGCVTLNKANNNVLEFINAYNQAIAVVKEIFQILCVADGVHSVRH